MKIAKDKRVRVKLKLQVEDGEVLEESAVEYHHGAGNMLAGLEAELEGLEKGAKKSGVIPAAKAFGAPENMHDKTIPRSEFPKDAELEVGSSFVAGGEGGQQVVIELKEIGDDEVKAVLKHMLWDKNIAFEVEIIDVLDPPKAPPPLPADAIELEED